MEPLPVASRIDAVTVYRRGARVRRVAELDRDQDGYPRAVRITGLPLGIDDGSVRARVLADAGQAPVAADLRVALEVPGADDALPPADDAELERLQREAIRAQAVVEQLEREICRLEELTLIDRPAGAEGEPPPESPTDSRLALLTMRVERETELRAELRDAKAALREVTRKLEHAKAVDARASTARQAREHELRKSVIVRLRGGSAPAARLEIEYQVPGARWAPAYTIRLDRQMSRAELAMRAMVGQRTGEDWSAVELTLSTASATQWSELPELHSVRIGRAQPPPPRAGWRPPPTGVEALYADYDRAFAGTGDDGLETEEQAAAGRMEREIQEALEHERVALERQRLALEAQMQMMEEARAEQARALDDMVRMSSQPMSSARPASTKSGGIFGAIGGMLSRGDSAGAPASIEPPMAMPAPPPAPQPEGRYARTVMGGAPPQGGTTTMSLGSDKHAAFAAPPLDLDSTELAAPDDLLDYGRLRMPPARSSERGKLRPAAQRELYLELLVHQRVEISFDVLTVVQAAVRSASTMDEAALPEGHRADWSEHHDYAYVSDHAADLPSDGDFHSLPLRAGEGDVSLLFVTVPRESTDVFRTVEVTNPLSSPLLPGPADVYVGDEFLLTSEVGFTAAAGTVDLGLGVDQAVKVARNTSFREETKGLLGGGLELKHQISIDLHNHLEREIDVEVRERIPVVREDEDDIEIRMGVVTPAWQPWDPFPERAANSKLRGGYRWKVSLASKASAQLSANYVVEIPSKLELIGGNRREG